jgi:laminin alpha 1/2
VNLTSSTSTSISLVYAVDNVDDSDGLLAYVANGDPAIDGDGDDTRDFMALEMVDRQIRFVWNNGAGTRAIVHNATIEPALGGSLKDNMWYKITAERIGNIGRLNVRKVKPVYVRPEYNRWVVGESAATANVFNIHRQDLLYVGGGAIPDNLRSGQLLSSGKMAGVLYHLEVDGQFIGLWNFVTNAGCRETHSGILLDMQSSEHACYTFNGKGYAMQQDIRNYDPRYLSVSLEFKSFDSNAVLFYASNEYTVSI